MQTSNMTEIIYDYFTSRIRFGYFMKGEQLPSIPNIRRQFGVSALTVRSALSQMKENGYIETTERVPATVIFQTDEQSRQDYVQYFLSHREGLEDVCHSSELIFGPIIHQYFQRQDMDSIKRMQSKMKNADFRTAKPVIMFYAESMRVLNNSLIPNLHWEIVRYLSTPYLERPLNFEETNSQAAAHIRRILDLLEAGQFTQAAEEDKVFNENVTYQFLKKIQFSFKNEQLEIEQVPFRWHIYWDHPQLCYTIAAEIMSKIDKQIYKQGDFLPSCRALSIEYGISFITARRTVSLLNDLRVAESLNGIGARVILGRDIASPNLLQPQIRKSLILFLQAMQISSLTCRNVAVHTLSSIDDRNLSLFEQDIQAHLENDTTYLTGGLCLRFIGDNSPSPFIREVYGQLYRLMLWGHSLHMFYRKDEDAGFYNKYTGNILDALRKRDIHNFAALLSELIASGLTISKKIMIQHGFEEDQLI